MILLNKGLSTGMSDLGFPKGDVLVPRCGRYLNVQLFALQGESSCGENDVGETMRNCKVRITEHSNICHTSEPARHLLENPSHSFQWSIKTMQITKTAF